MKIFNPDSPFMVVLSRIADLILINIFTLILCIPIVTGGAAITAGYYTLLKIRRDEDSGTTKLYFGSFKENFKQADLSFNTRNPGLYPCRSQFQLCGGCSGCGEGYARRSNPFGGFPFFDGIPGSFEIRKYDPRYY